MDGEAFVPGFCVCSADPDFASDSRLPRFGSPKHASAMRDGCAVYRKGKKLAHSSAVLVCFATRLWLSS